MLIESEPSTLVGGVQRELPLLTQEARYTWLVVKGELGA
jgi:hypothetical protein